MRKRIAQTKNIEKQKEEFIKMVTLNPNYTNVGFSKFFNINKDYNLK